MAESGKHDAGCVYGGFSCGYWMVVDGCQEEHLERHHIIDDEGNCPCGNSFEDAKRGWTVECDLHALPAEGRMR